MSNCGLMTNKASQFVRSLIKNDSICFLDLSYNNFTSDDYNIAASLGVLIKTHYFLLHLNLASCQMQVEETMYVGLCVRESNQLMSIHLTGNSCHVYGRSYIRTSLGSEPQYPYKKRYDIDSSISPIDISLLMKFSLFYKQRILPDEVFKFFIK